jgi:peptidoglycan hydrolase-like protein with peptidoglycan-binding domain
MNIFRILSFAGAALMLAALTAVPAAASPAESQPASPQVETSSPLPIDTPIYVGAAALSRIQETLNQTGHEAGPADGIWGKATASAVKRFQRFHSLAPTGTLTIETIQALNLPDILNGSFATQTGNALTGKTTSSGGSAQLFINPSDLESVQQFLLNQGFGVAKVDGAWGHRTQQAIRDFQSKNGMAPTGHVSPELLSRLGFKQVVAALGSGEASGSRQSPPQTARGYYGTTPQGEQHNPEVQHNAQGKGAPLFAGTGMIQRIQKALNDAGYHSGQTDGFWHASTAKALAAYQKDENMAPTGTLTLATIKALVGGF